MKAARPLANSWSPELERPISVWVANVLQPDACHMTARGREYYELVVCGGAHELYIFWFDTAICCDEKFPNPQSPFAQKGQASSFSSVQSCTEIQPSRVWREWNFHSVSISIEILIYWEPSSIVRFFRLLPPLAWAADSAVTAHSVSNQPASEIFSIRFPPSQLTTHRNRPTFAMATLNPENPIYGPFFGVMGAASAIIFSGKPPDRASPSQIHTHFGTRNMSRETFPPTRPARARTHTHTATNHPLQSLSSSSSAPFYVFVTDLSRYTTTEPLSTSRPLLTANTKHSQTSNSFSLLSLYTPKYVMCLVTQPRYGALYSPPPLPPSQPSKCIYQIYMENGQMDVGGARRKGVVRKEERTLHLALCKDAKRQSRQCDQVEILILGPRTFSLEQSHERERERERDRATNSNRYWFCQWWWWWARLCCVCMCWRLIYEDSGFFLMSNKKNNYTSQHRNVAAVHTLYSLFVSKGHSSWIILAL